MNEKDFKKQQRSLEIVHEGVNFDFCRKVIVTDVGNGFCKVKMEAYITPKRKKDEY